MSYTDIPDADIDVGSYGRTDLVFTRLRDNINACRESLFPVAFAEASTVSLTFVTLATLSLYVPSLPDYAGIQRLLDTILEVKVASGTGTYRLKDSASGNTGSEVTTTATGYENKTLALNLDAAWKGTMRTILIEGKSSAGALTYARSVDRVAGRVVF